VGGVCHIVVAIRSYRGRAGTGLSVLWVAFVTSLLLSAAIVEELELV
jgi:hypothetical protein